MSFLARTGGLLLAGGRSTRFGSEKAVAAFGDGVLMDAAASLLGDCATFAVSAPVGSGAAAHAAARGVEVLHDDPKHAPGPLAGVCAGLVWAEARGFAALATAPCDCPALPENLFEALAAGMGDAPAAYAATHGGVHPLCAVWRTALAGPLRAALAGGEHPAVHGLLAAQGARVILFSDEDAFANANTEAALASLKAPRSTP